MKGEHRHDLETNWLAHRLAKAIKRASPYGPTILGVVGAVVAFLLMWAYLTSSSSARQSEAWSAYMAALESPSYDRQSREQALAMLRESAEEHKGTTMQYWADATWADGQVWSAASEWTRNRDAAREAVSSAAAVYRRLLSSTSDPRLINRAHFGLGRIYEMENDLKRAKEHYALVSGGFVELAQARLRRIDDPKDKQRLEETLSWLATAKPTPRRSPTGPGTPGQQPAFSPSDLKMPSTTTDEPSLDDIFSRLQTATGSEGDERYDAGDSAASDDTPADASDAGETPPSSDSDKPSSDDSSN